MSINVTVSGNPVRIARGNVVTCDPCKSEFEKRRLIRLEQVRQQSKDIAENIRNKFKNEKKKCLSKIEKDGEVKLQNWQARKLLELRDQYEETLDEIGLGHKEAINVEDEEVTYVEQQESNEKLARERGRAAADRLQVEKNEENLMKAAPIQRKKLIRDVENSRSNAVAGLHKEKSPFKKKKKKKKKPTQQSFDSDSENRVPQLFEVGELDSASCTCSDIEIVREPSKRNTSKEQQTSAINLQAPTSEKAAQTLQFQEIPISEVMTDTRISEHIKRRSRLNHQPDYCDFVQKELPLKTFNGTTHCSCCQCPSKFQQPGDIICQSHHQPKFQEPIDLIDRSQQLPRVLVDRSQQQSREFIDMSKTQQPSNKYPEEETASRPSQPSKDAAVVNQKPSKEVTVEQPSKTVSTSKAYNGGDTEHGKKVPKPSEKRLPKTKDKKEIPPKPKITLKSTKPTFGGEPSKPVQFYDHPNRFAKQYLPKSSLVEKIDDVNLAISPNVSEDEFFEKMRKRDIEAQIRGQVAIEKEKIQREYRELLKKLPVLQKQERIYEIGTDKEKYHMSTDRLDDLERKRQNRLDNAYEELLVRRKPAIVTLPKRKEEEETLPSLNLAWDVDFIPESVHPNTQTSNTRTEQLSNLLSDLKSQKDSLLKEIENTLSKETLTRLTKSSYVDIKSKSTDYPQSMTKRKRNRDDGSVSPSSSVEEESERRTKSSREKYTTSTATTIPSPRKKAKLKSKSKVLVLQNTSTQTTPKPGQSVSTSPLTTPGTKPEDTCPCRKLLEDELCEILIRIKEDEKPEVIVNPPSLGATVKVTTEEKKVESPIKVSSEEKKVKSPSAVNFATKEKIVELPPSVRSSTTSKKSSIKKPSQASSSWRENLSRTTSSQSTSSTSYYEPPSFGKSPNESEKVLDPRLLTYIKKLLNMSRTSIDELAISASDVSTPSASVVETPANNPLLQLLSVMKYFNLDFADLQKQLSFHSKESSPHYNTSESVTVTSSSSDGTSSVQFQSCTDIGSDGRREETNVQVDSAERQLVGKKLEQYADIAASCTKKISSLTAMIEKVRAEKKKILLSPPTSSEGDKELSTTSYLGLPDKSKNSSQLGPPDKSKDSSSSSSRDEIDQDLLNIDYSYAERLKNLSSDEIAKEKKRIEHNQNLLTALKTLVDGDSTSGKKVTIRETTSVRISPPEDHQKQPEATPLFLDIPKLPKLEAPSLDKKKKRPPPSKGLKVLGGPTPHELSTIVEADSQISTKAESPVKAQKNSNDSKSSSSVPDILVEVQQKDPSNSSDDVSEMETMETMLISIGMEWAIPTLKKTREALALNSSSSDSKKDSGEVSLREFLSKISSTSSTNDSKSVLSDSQSQGISLIEVDNRRTSTPIQGNRIDAKKDGEQIFPTDSDISSVREQSGGSKSYDFNEGSLSKTG